jgi:DNA-binding response OmpR family regulator/tetratricopeptide (TPR) repeat protein
MPKILIIDDNEILASIIKEFLQKKGMDAEIALDGVTGLQYFSASAYDLLLVDLRLPELNGDDVCRNIRTMDGGRTIPIIMMSGIVKDPNEIAKLRAELSLLGFLTKPFAAEAMFTQITSALEARPASPEAGTPVPTLPATPGWESAQKLPSPIRGSLDRTPFEQVLLYLMFKRGTGFLTVSREGQSRRFSFIDGGAVELEVPPSDDDFGNYLARKNLVNAAELQEYEERRRSGSPDPRDLFIKMGCLTLARFLEENRNFLHDQMIDCFSWKSGAARFEWGPTIVRAVPAAVAFMPAIFYQGFRTHLPPSRISDFLREKGNLYVSKTPEFFEYQNHLADEIPGTELFDLINGVSTCSGIVSSFDSDEIAVVLYTLDYLKLLAYHPTAKRSDVAPPFPVRERRPKQPAREAKTFEDIGSELSEIAEVIDNLEILAGPEAAAPAADDAGGTAALEEDLKQQWEAIKDKNYYEMFGMTAKTFSFEKLKNAYFALTKTYGPEKFFTSSGEVMELAEEFLSRISNAYTTLSDVVSKENYDELLASVAPSGAEEKKFYEQVQFQSAKVLMEKGQYDSAEKTFTTCINLNPDRVEYQAYLAVAMYHNPANRDNPAAIKKAKELVNKALQWEKLPIAYALKGQMLLDEGLVNLAESEFNKALRLNPQNKTALKGLEAIRLRREEEEKKGGLFTRMFK